jgi:hypothetical protein
VAVSDAPGGGGGTFVSFFRRFLVSSPTETSTTVPRTPIDPTGVTMAFWPPPRRAGPDMKRNTPLATDTETSLARRLGS